MGRHCACRRAGSPPPPEVSPDPIDFIEPSFDTGNLDFFLFVRALRPCTARIQVIDLGAPGTPLFDQNVEIVIGEQLLDPGVTLTRYNIYEAHVQAEGYPDHVSASFSPD